MKVLAAVAIPLVAACVGCGWREDHDADRTVKLPADIIVSKPIFPTQRFISTNSGDVAFDTKTGSLCRTWAWEVYTYSSKNVSRATRTCQSLYEDDVHEEDRKIAEAREEREAKR